MSLFRFVLIATLLAGSVGALAANPMLGAVELKAAGRPERDAGVWLDGHYFGFVRELKGKHRLMLVPGRHQLQVKLAGYQDLTAAIDVEPGEERRYEVRLVPLESASYPDADETATVRVAVSPDRAALFVNGVYAGHVERFSGRQGLRLRAGTHRFRVALPGYQPFETEMTLVANQHYEIKTKLPKGSMRDQPADVVARAADTE